MADLDANSGSGVAVAAASSHSHVIDMPQLDASGRSAVAAATDHSQAVDTTGSRASCSAGDDKCSTGSDDIPSCAVCMEPLEWVAVGPCGHRVVCSVCAARVRSAPKPDHLCCICRTLCPTVLVTKAAAATADGELPFSEIPAATQDGQVGEYWYCAAMSAYFDDEEQYEATAKAAAAAACLKQRPAGADDDDGERDQQYETAQFLKYSFFAALFGVCIGFVFAVDAPGWGGKVGIVAGSAALSVAVGSDVQCMAQLDADGGSVASAAHSRVIDMVQLDANSRRSAAAGDDHRHVIDMTRLDANTRSAAASAADGRIDGRGNGSTGSDDVPSCVVCTEPLEWVAVGPCGHRAVCSACAAHLRSAPDSDKRCCICRRICPTVVVTKAAAGVVTFSTLPAAINDGRVGEYWYCAAVSAYFDDEQQYEAAKAAAPRQCAQEELVALVVLLAALFGVIIGSIIASAIGVNDWNSDVGIVLGSTVVSVGGTVAVVFCRSNNQDRRRCLPTFQK
uniref:RING-type domain-containing protein n=1 Tax=Oryza punctata TaxID=4537 RepID=A0A0E0JK91_ORYPU